mgnify:FL=1
MTRTEQEIISLVGRIAATPRELRTMESLDPVTAGMLREELTMEQSQVFDIYGFPGCFTCPDCGQRGDHHCPVDCADASCPFCQRSMTSEKEEK